jgi:hypothetical protein
MREEVRMKGQELAEINRPRTLHNPVDNDRWQVVLSPDRLIAAQSMRAQSVENIRRIVSSVIKNVVQVFLEVSQP